MATDPLQVTAEEPPEDAVEWDHPVPRCEVRIVANGTTVFCNRRRNHPGRHWTHWATNPYYFDVPSDDLKVAAAWRGAPPPEPIRAHVEGCPKALSVPVDLCACGGRDFTPQPGGRGAPPEAQGKLT